MQIIKLYPEGFAANSYLLTADGMSAVAIDPAQPRVAEEAVKRGLKVTHVLLTHGHFDHIGGCAALQAVGARIGLLHNEVSLATGAANMAAAFGVYVPAFGVDFTLKDGEAFRACGMCFSVIATPGHTAGSACYRIGSELFTGDTLFAGGVGRCDFPTGDGAALAASLRKLAMLEGDFSVHAGHGDDTTLSYEKKYNGWLKC